MSMRPMLPKAFGAPVLTPGREPPSRNGTGREWIAIPRIARFDS